MSTYKNEFAERLLDQWLPSFCSAQDDSIHPEGFAAKNLERLSDLDAMWFLRALKAKYVYEENGFFTSELSKAKEMILWAGSTSDHPRKIYLWLEPIINIGALARLIDSYQWPQSQVGLQSRAPWPFDLIGYDTDRETELLACEVKKSVRECQRLLEEMKHFSAQPPLAEEPRKSVVRNAYRKVVGIRRSWPVVFWAVGPGGKDNVFEVVRAQGSDVFSLEPATRNRLRFG